MEPSEPIGDVDELLARMHRVRASGYNHAGELQGEAMRLVDWKEYVRSKPLMSIAVASLVGFSVVRSTLGTTSQVNPAFANGNNTLENSTPSRSSWKSAAIGLIANVASTAAKHYLASFLQPHKSEGGFNDRFRSAGSKEQSIGSAP